MEGNADLSLAWTTWRHPRLMLPAGPSVSRYLNAGLPTKLSSRLSFGLCLEHRRVGADARCIRSAQRFCQVRWGVFISRTDAPRAARGFIGSCRIEQLKRTIFAAALDAQNQSAITARSTGQWDWLVPMSAVQPQHPIIAVALGSRALAKAPVGDRASLLAELSPTACWYGPGGYS